MGEHVADCDDVRELIGCNKGCCVSCHGEWEDGYGWPEEYDLPDGRVAMVCCALFDPLEAWLAGQERRGKE